MQIKIERVAGGFVWRFYIPDLIRAAAESRMLFPRYDSAVKDAIRFRRNIGVDVGIFYETPKGKVKAV